MRKSVSRGTFSSVKLDLSVKMKDIKYLLNEVGIFITNAQVKKLQQYLNLLLQWNQRINLISRSDESRLVERHVLESIAVLKGFKIQYGARIIDVGSGAGFPALPLSLVRTDLNFLLVESKRLKTLFLKEAVQQLKLSQLQIICDRVENLSKDKYRIENFDFAFSRAVASLDVVYGWIQHLLKYTGCYIAWKGGDIQQEIENLLSKFKNVDIEVIKMDAQLINPTRKKVFVCIQRKN